MGGMKLSDFADLEIEDGDIAGEGVVSYDSSDSEGGDPLDSPTIHLAPLPLETGSPTSASELADLLHAHPVPASKVIPTVPEIAEVFDTADEELQHEEPSFEVLMDETDEPAVTVELDNLSPVEDGTEPGPEDAPSSPPHPSVLAEKDVNVEPGPSELPTSTSTGDEDESASHTGDEDEDSEMGDLPVSRAAPAALPYSPLGPMRMSDSLFRSPIVDREPAAVTSPFKQPALDTSPIENITSSSKQSLSLTPARIPRQLGPLPTTWTPSQVREDLAPLAERPSKVLKPRLPAPVSAKKPEPAPHKEKSKTLAIRGKLDSMFASKFGSMGPPQRTVSASSLASSSSSSSGTGNGITNRPASRTGMQAPKPDLKSSSSKFGSAMPRPASSQSIRPTASSTSRSTLSNSTFGRPAVASSSTIKPTTSRPTIGASSVPSRPALAPRSLITHPAQQAHVKVMEGRVSRPIPAEPPRQSASKRPASVASAAPKLAVQVNPLKRPLSLSSLHSTMRQSVATGPGAPRPALGLPSRLVRDAHQSRGGPVFQVGLGSADFSSSRQAYRSPLRQPAQRGLGTPQAQRTAKVSRLCAPRGRKSTDVSWAPPHDWMVRRSVFEASRPSRCCRRLRIAQARTFSMSRRQNQLARQPAQHVRPNMSALVPALPRVMMPKGGPVRITKMSQ
jgi:hypothetical protein